MTIIPTPVCMTHGEGTWTVPVVLPIRGSSEAAELLAERLRGSAGIDVQPGGSGPGVEFVVDDTLAPEGYRLQVDDGGVRLEHATHAGAVWAVQSLLQLLPRAVHTHGPMEPSSLVLPHIRIDDAPRLAWRGSMIDVARHFLPIDGLHRHLEIMAMHKLNVLHLHLTDDQGWRFPVPGWPKLTELGAWRPGTLPGHQPPPDEEGCHDVAHHDGIPHGGWYTVQELDELREHARRLAITIVPEVDMPGHMEAAVAAHPELGASAVAHPRTCWGISEHVLRLDDTTIQFCKDVLDAVMDLFPDSPIHVGGDECPGSEWLSDEPTKATMARHGLTAPTQAQAWFEQVICQHVLDRGRRVIAWDEVLEGGVPQDVTVQVWRDAASIAHGIEGGYDVIASPTSHTYLDYGQGRWADHPLVIAGQTTMEQVSTFVDVLQDLPAGPGRLLGAQFQLWSEYVRDWAKAEYQLWPRGTSLAQQFWAGRRASGEEVEPMLRRLTGMGINWCREGTR